MWDPTANDEAIEAWNGVLFDKWVRFRHLLTDGLAGHGDALMAGHPPPEGGRVIDLGCGLGDTTLTIARAIGPRGLAVGVDASDRFVEASRKSAVEAGLDNARFEVADVQVSPLGGPYDYAFSRFGVQFFSSPVMALRNVRRSLRPGGLLGVVVWRQREDNPWLHAAQVAVEAVVPQPEKSDQPTCGPGPFSMAGADMVSGQLLAAGYVRPTFQRHEFDIKIGDDLDEAIEFAMALGPAGELLRLAGADAERYQPAVLKALRETLTRFVRPEGVLAPSSTWLITATAP
ncbi:MAG TPA: class I SAM-dependent methyltransferase [Kofleriaceae bacterium]|nr:class I SAM-dependent methyltransferase [Kofleriaceae bacterium]